MLSVLSFITNIEDVYILLVKVRFMWKQSMPLGDNLLTVDEFCIQEKIKDIICD